MDSEHSDLLAGRAQTVGDGVVFSEYCHVDMNFWSEDTVGMLACLGGTPSPNDDVDMSLEMKVHSALEKRLALTLEQGNGDAIPNLTKLLDGVNDECDLQLTLGRSFPRGGVDSKVVEVKRGPGRPRKNPAVVPDSLKGGAGSVKPKRGPGRPRKRHRGRPKKDIHTISNVFEVNKDASQDLVKTIG